MPDWPIERIRVGEQPRENLPDIEQLAASIADVGLLQPLVVTEDGRLVAGHRRLAALKARGAETVPVRIVAPPEGEEDAE